MIPKIIHYCWFGGNPLPALVIKCIESWKKYCPDYEIIEWNESNFMIDSNNYVLQAYKERKYAFVSDYVRLKALYDYGGIYMDTDVEVLKSLDKFLIHDAFSGFENFNNIPTGIIGALKGHRWIEILLKDYTNRSFILENGQMDITTNLASITKLTKNYYEITLNNTYQELNDGLVFYPSVYFCPKEWESGRMKVTSETFTIHHFSGSWLPEEVKQRIEKQRKNLLYKIRQNLKHLAIKILSEERYHYIRKRL